MPTRNPYSGSSAPPVSGVAFLNQYADNIKKLFAVSALPLANIGGSANSITATVDPEFDADGLTDGMKFTFSPIAQNTDTNVYLKINTQNFAEITKPNKVDIDVGYFQPGKRELLEYVGGRFVVLGYPPEPGEVGGGGTGSISGIKAIRLFTSSGTWNPNGNANSALIFCTGGGGGATGNTGIGGGAGGTGIRLVSDTTSMSSQSVIIGSGGNGSATGVVGSSSSVGGLVTGNGGSAGGNGGSASGSGVYIITGGNGIADVGGSSFWGSQPAPGGGGRMNNTFPDHGKSGCVLILEFG